MTNTRTLLLVERDEAAAQVFETPRFEIVFACTKSPDKGVSEDALLCTTLADGRVVACAIDGMGGMQGGREAAALGATALRDHIAEHVEGGADLGALLVDGFRRAHREVARGCPRGGATAVAAGLSGDGLVTVHSGDAEALLFGPDGGLRARTVSHSPVGHAVHRGVLTEEEGLLHPDRHLVSGGFGIEPFEVEASDVLPFGAGDTLLLASDGLTDNALAAEIGECLRGSSLLDCLDGLVDLTHARMQAAILVPDGMMPGKPDDLTVIAVRRKE